MKRLFFLLMFTLGTSFIYAQSNSAEASKAPTAVPDKDKLLEYYQNQRFEEAAAYLQEFYKNDNQDPKILSQLGYVNLMAGKLEEAENIYLKLYAQEPRNQFVLFNLVTIELKKGNEEKAKEYYKEIVTLLGKANKTFASALATDTANLQMLKSNISISMAGKDYTEVIQTGQKLLSLGDTSRFVIDHLATAYFLVLDYKNALTYFLKIKDQAGDNEGLFYNIALCYRGLKDYKNGALYLQKAITEGISPKTASYYGLLGDSYEYINKNEDAIAAYKRGLLFENNGSLYYNIAQVYEKKLNDKKNAIAYYNLYLKNFKDMDKSPRHAAFIKNKIEELKR